MRVRSLVVAAVAVVAGCQPTPSLDGGTAETDSGVASGGGGGSDAGATDAGVVDAGTPDGGVDDAGTADAGPPDGGELDSGTMPPDGGNDASGGALDIRYIDDAGTEYRVLPAKGFGGFNTNNTGSPWNANDPGYLTAVQELRARVLRFPGGTNSNYYDFDTDQLPLTMLNRFARLLLCEALPDGGGVKYESDGGLKIDPEILQELDRGRDLHKIARLRGGLGLAAMPDASIGSGIVYTVNSFSDWGNDPLNDGTYTSRPQWDDRDWVIDGGADTRAARGRALVARLNAVGFDVRLFNLMNEPYNAVFSCFFENAGNAMGMQPGPDERLTGVESRGWADAGAKVKNAMSSPGFNPNDPTYLADKEIAERLERKFLYGKGRFLGRVYLAWLAEYARGIREASTGPLPPKIGIMPSFRQSLPLHQGFNRTLSLAHNARDGGVPTRFWNAINFHTYECYGYSDPGDQKACANQLLNAQGNAGVVTPPTPDAYAFPEDAGYVFPIKGTYAYLEELFPGVEKFVTEANFGLGVEDAGAGRPLADAPSPLTDTVYGGVYLSEWLARLSSQENMGSFQAHVLAGTTFAARTTYVEKLVNGQVSATSPSFKGLQLQLYNQLYDAQDVPLVWAPNASLPETLSIFTDAGIVNPWTSPVMKTEGLYSSTLTAAGPTAYNLSVGKSAASYGFALALKAVAPGRSVLKTWLSDPSRQVYAEVYVGQIGSTKRYACLITNKGHVDVPIRLFSKKVGLENILTVGHANPAATNTQGQQMITGYTTLTPVSTPIDPSGSSSTFSVGPNSVTLVEWTE